MLTVTEQNEQQVAVGVSTWSTRYGSPPVRSLIKHGRVHDTASNARSSGIKSAN